MGNVFSLTSDKKYPEIYERIEMKVRDTKGKVTMRISPGVGLWAD